MVYIDRNGRVLEKRPWDIARVLGIFTGIWFVVVQFFMTLLAPFQGQNNGSSSRSDSRRGGWGPGGGGGGGGNGRPGGGGPNRRIGRVVNTSMDCNIPGGG